jgi:hypothetical protein
MSGIVFDNFTLTQGDNQSRFPNSSWGPTSGRVTFSDTNGISAVNILTPGWLVLTNATDNVPSYIEYLYTSSINFNQITNINISGQASGNYDSLRIALTDDTLVTEERMLDQFNIDTLTATWNIANFTTVDITNINSMRISFLSPSDSIDLLLFSLTSTPTPPPPPICVSGDTMVLMADGTEKPIRDVQTGELVYSDINKTEIRKVAKAIKNVIDPDVKIRAVKIQQNALGPNQPNRETIMTASHPIVWNNERIRAKHFRHLDGVKFYKNIEAKNILPRENNGQYMLYDLVLEDNNYYVANGLQVQAHSPECFIGLLPNESFFKKIREEPLVDYPHPLVAKDVTNVDV